MQHAQSFSQGTGESASGWAVDALWRYPVKSMAGQQMQLADVDADGLQGDRLLAVIDELSGQIMTLRSAPQLLYAQASLPLNGPALTERVKVVFPGGTSVPAFAAHEAASTWLGRRVKILSWEARRGASTGYDYFDYGFGLDYSSTASFGDTPKALHIVSTGTLNWLESLGHRVDERRLRPNIVLDLGPEPFGEDSLLGQEIVMGPVRLSCSQATERCSLLDAAQPGLEPAPGLRDQVFTGRKGNLGIYATVSTPGLLRVGDPVELIGRA